LRPSPRTRQASGSSIGCCRRSRRRSVTSVHWLRKNWRIFAMDARSRRRHRSERHGAEQDVDQPPDQTGVGESATVRRSGSQRTVCRQDSLAGVISSAGTFDLPAATNRCAPLINAAGCVVCVRSKRFCGSRAASVIPSPRSSTSHRLNRS